MPAGRPPKPIEQKRRSGNPGGRPLPPASKLAAVPAIEPAPAEMEPVQVLDLVLEHGRAWLATSDTVAVAMLRESLEERANLREIVMATQSPDARKSLRDLDKQIISELAALGFDPSARSRLGVAEVRAQSTLERLRQEQAKPARG
jgi:hypothetical protein